MKKVFGTIAAVIGFLGLTTFIIFNVESASTRNYSLPPSNLSADIAANDPLAAIGDVAAPADQPVAGDAASATTTPPDSVPQALVDASVQAAQTTSSDQVAPQAPSQTDATTTTTADTSTPPPTPAPSIPSTPDQTPPPATFAINTPATSTEATATITVTPTVSTPPPAPAAQVITITPQAATGGLALPYNESSFTGDSNWQRIWGVMATTWNSLIDLSAGPAGTGGTIYLKNASGWANYTMNASVDWVGGNTLGLMANYNDASNYALCEYKKSGPGVITMQLAQYANGIETPLTPGTSVSWSGNGSGLNLSIKVNGTHGVCSFNGQSVSNDVIGPGMSAMSSPGSGGIGFTVSDPTSNTSEIVVRQVSVAGN